MTEKALQEAVIKLAKYAGWWVYHPYDSRRSEPGFPDLAMVHVGRKMILFRELKAEKGRLTEDQDAWLTALTEAGADACVWRPEQWNDGTIERVLTGR